MAKKRRGGKTKKRKGPAQPASTADALAMAEARLRQGKPEEAAKLLATAEASDARVVALRRRIDNLRWRRLQRQRKAEPLQTAAVQHPALALPAARLAGRPALAAMAAGEGRDAGLAACALAPDATQALKTMRARCPDLADCAGAWMLLLKGRTEAALERFAGVADRQPRRAALGQAVCLAVLGRGDEARSLWQTLGPLPGGVFPRAAAFATWLEDGEQTPLSDLLHSDDTTRLDRAVRTCPKPAAERQAWLLLRLGDRLDAEGESQRAEQCYRRALGRHPAVAIDARKRLFHLQLQHEDAPDQIFPLYEALLERDAATAREAVEELGPLITDGHLASLAHHRWLPQGTRPPLQLPPEWARLWLRRALGADSFGLMAMAMAMLGRNPSCDLPRSVRDLDPLLKQLDTAYGDGDPDYLRLLMRVYRHYGNRSRQRRICFRLMLEDPVGAGDLVSEYVSLALQDKRGRTKTLAELAQLLERLPQVLRLHVLAAVLGGGDEEEAILRCERACGPTAGAFLRWRLDLLHRRKAPLPDGLLGRDVQVDSHMISNLATLETLSRGLHQTICRQLMADPDACLLACECCLREGYVISTAFLSLWLRHQRRGWQAPYITLRMIAGAANPDQAITILEELRDGGDLRSWQELHARAADGIAEHDHARRSALADANRRLSQLEAMFDDDDDDDGFDLGLGSAFDGLLGDDDDEDQPSDLCPQFWHGLTPMARQTLIRALGDIDMLLDDPFASILPYIEDLTSAQRAVLADFSNALITEATMFDPRVQEDPIYRQLMSLGPARIRAGGAP